MKTSFNEKLIAYLTLFSGLAISAVAEYYSIMGLMAIYPAAVIPIVIMGIVLGLGKISGTVWLKQNWDNAPFFLRAYILPAVIALMLITSLGVFGYLSKAHSDQSLVSGDVQSKIAVYDEKIKVAKENIDANRKALKQMDESVDQVMGRSQDEKGADKAVALRKGQAKERTRLLSEITAEQKAIAQLSEERAPVAAEVRKVEAEVGPIKYIAHLLYGENPDANILEKAVIWVTVLIVIVLDPLAVILLLASQYSFQYFREREAEGDSPIGPIVDVVSPDTTVTEEIVQEGDSPQEPTDVVGVESTVTTTATVVVPDWGITLITADNDLDGTELSKDPHTVGWMYTEHPGYYVADVGEKPTEEEKAEIAQEDPIEFVVTNSNPADNVPVVEPTVEEPPPEYVTVDGQRMHYKVAKEIYNTVTEPSGAYVQNEEQNSNSKWNRVISEAEYRDQAQLKKQDDSKNNADNSA